MGTDRRSAQGRARNWTLRWSAGLAVVGVALAAGAIAAAAPASPIAVVADHQVHAGVTLAVGKGVHVHITGGGGGTSNCTRDESGFSLTTQHDRERHLVSFVAKSGGSCDVSESWSNFRVTVTEPGVHGTGTFFLGQKAIAGGYQATCEKRSGNQYHHEWSHLACHRDSQYEVLITKA